MSACSIIIITECILSQAEMARPKSEDKRKAILTAATEVFAEKGLSAATSVISREAGVAEGTLFTYFATKDDLVNALYREIKGDLAEAMMSGFPRKKGVRERLQHVWDKYLDWGLANPQAHAAMRQIQVWSGLTPESREAANAPFVEIHDMAEAAIAQRVFQKIPSQFVAASMSALVETTMVFMREHPTKASMYRRAGFEMLWAGITCPR
jgi:AcrR family transcriptional regulator